MAEIDLLRNSTEIAVGCHNRAECRRFKENYKISFAYSWRQNEITLSKSNINVKIIRARQAVSIDN